MVVLSSDESDLRDASLPPAAALPVSFITMLAEDASMFSVTVGSRTRKAAEGANIAAGSAEVSAQAVFLSLYV